MSVLHILFEESDEDMSVAGEVERSGETLKVVQNGMVNRKLMRKMCLKSRVRNSWKLPRVF